MIDFVVIAIVAVILATAIMYIVKEKKRGVVCIGCPMAGECAKRKSGQACKNAVDTDKK